MLLEADLSPMTAISSRSTASTSIRGSSGFEVLSAMICSNTINFGSNYINLRTNNKRISLILGPWLIFLWKFQQDTETLFANSENFCVIWSPDCWESHSDSNALYFYRTVSQNPGDLGKPCRLWRRWWLSWSRPCSRKLDSSKMPRPGFPWLSIFLSPTLVDIAFRYPKYILKLAPIFIIQSDQTWRKRLCTILSNCTFTFSSSWVFSTCHLTFLSLRTQSSPIKIFHWTK